MHIWGMSWLDESQDHLPLTWWKGRPIFLAAILALVALVSMVVTAILGSAAAHWFAFSYDGFFHGLRLWTPLTYALVNGPSLWLVIGCVIIWQYGERLERHLGRRSFVKLVVILLALSPMLTSLLGVLGASVSVAAGVHQLTFGIFVAFATLYPRAQVSLIVAVVEIWIIAAVLIGVILLSCLAARDWSTFLLLSGQVIAAYSFVRYEQGQLQLPRMTRVMPERRTAPRATAPSVPRKTKTTKAKDSGMADVDSILDKISRDGIHSLTPQERSILARASDDLQKRRG